MASYRPLVVVAGLALAVLSACSSGASHDSAGPSATPSPTEQRATIGQYAGLINASQKEMRETWAKYEDKECAFEESVVCNLTVLTLKTEADIVVLQLTGAVKPGVPAYIGKPPVEIEKLVADTLAAAQRVRDLIGEGHTLDANGRYAVSNLMSVFDRWEPYI